MMMIGLCCLPAISLMKTYAVNVGSLYVDLPLGASQMKIEEVTDYVKALSKFQDC